MQTKNKPVGSQSSQVKLLLMEDGHTLKTERAAVSYETETSSGISDYNDYM